MLYNNLAINKVVCLLCGGKTAVKELVVQDVGNVESIPDGIKDKGAFFQTLICPKCSKSVYFGFIIDDEAVIPSTKKDDKTSVDANIDVIHVDEEAADIPLPTKQQPTTGVKRSEDGTIDLDAPRVVPNRLKQRKVKCSGCGQKFSVGTQDMSGFGSKCKSCLDKLVPRK